MENMLKVAGKYKGDGTDALYIKLSFTSGFMGLNGQVTASASYNYSDPITVSDGDVIKVVDSGWGNSLVRVYTCFSNGVAVQSAGVEHDPATNDSFTVPSGVDAVVVTVPASSTSGRLLKVIPSGTRAVPFAVTKDGEIILKRIWETKTIMLAQNASIRDTSSHTYPAVDQHNDISGYALASIRIRSTLGVPYTLHFLNDDYNSDVWTKDINGTVNALTIDSTDSNVLVITPEDVPYLAYMRELHIRFQAKETPESGSLTMKVICKR